MWVWGFTGSVRPGRAFPKDKLGVIVAKVLQATLFAHRNARISLAAAKGFIPDTAGSALVGSGILLAVASSTRFPRDDPASCPLVHPFACPGFFNLDPRCRERKPPRPSPRSLSYLHIGSLRDFNL